jgi:autotransporter-associated beta strand protein
MMTIKRKSKNKTSLLLEAMRLNCKAYFGLISGLLILIPNLLFSQFEIASDNAGNYGGSWNSNQGSGFNDWLFTSNGGSGGFAGRFIGNPSSAGITGMSASSFGLFANPNVSGNESKARRTFSGGQLQIGDALEFQMGLNFDADNSDGFKGIDILNSAGNVILNFNMGNSATITWGSPTGGSNGTLFSAYGTQAMNFTITRTATNEYRVIATPRAGGANFDQIINLGGEVAGFEFYAGRLNAGDARQPYYNNLAITNSGVFNIASGTATYTRSLSGPGSLTKSGAGTLILTGNSNYTGQTTITSGELRLNPTVNATPASQFVLNGGTLATTGIATNRTITSSSTLQLNASSNINLGNVSHTVSFNASNTIAWNGAAELTISGWTGTAGASGTNGRIFIGNNAGGLTAAQLGQISFNGFAGKGMLLPSGELVPRQLMYRSRQNGNWNVASTWQFSRDGGLTWENSTSTTPTNADASIVVRDGHTVTVTANVTVDQVVIDAGGQVTLSGGTLTVSNGPGDDFVILGTYRRTSSTTTMSVNPGAIVRCANGGIYEHALSASGGSVPSITWEDESIFRLVNSQTTATAVTGLNQSFGIVEINRPGQTAATEDITFGDVRNELRVISTGTGRSRWNSAFSISGSYVQTGGAITVRTNTGASNFNVGGNFSIDGGTFRITDANGSSNAVTLNVDGNFTMSGGTFIFCATGTTSGPAFASIKGNVTISGGSFAGGFLVGTSGFYFNGQSSEQTLTFGLSLSSGVLNRFYYRSAAGGPTGLNEIYNGTSAQNTITGTGAAPGAGWSAWPTTGTLIKDLTIDNTAGVTLNSDKVINGTLSLANGLLNTGACNSTTTSSTLLTLADNATVSGASASSYVNGVMQKVGDDAFTFPIGNATTYQPVSLSAPALTTDRFGACFVESDPSVLGFDRTSKEASIANIADCHFWHINRMTGSSDVSVGLNVNCPSLLAADQIVVRWDGSEWKNEGGTFAGGVVTSNVVSNFSPFTTGNDINAVLPVTLLSFDVSCEADAHQLNWQTVSELNNHYFLIETSFDGENWRAITKIDGAGTTNAMQFYTYTVENVKSGIVYYRLKQFDFDGTMEELGVRAVICEAKEIRLFPNPSQQDLFISGLEKGSSISLYDMTGRLIKLTVADNVNFYWDISELQTGTYQVVIKTTTDNKRIPFVKL